MAYGQTIYLTEGGLGSLCNHGQISGEDWGPKPFRSLDVWLKEPGFKDMVKEKWKSYPRQGNNMFVFKVKMKCLKANLKRWNRDVFRHLESRKKKVLKEIEELDGQDEDDALPESLRMRRVALFSHVEEINKNLSLFSGRKLEIIGLRLEILTPSFIIL